MTVLPAAVILCREILVSGLREFLAEVDVGMPVSQLAKWKNSSSNAGIRVFNGRTLWPRLWIDKHI